MQVYIKGCECHRVLYHKVAKLTVKYSHKDCESSLVRPEGQDSRNNTENQEYGSELNDRPSRHCENPFV
jgi:hypothetical protein